MNSHLFFDFTVNKQENTISITREFAGSLQLVWRAWTDPKLLDQWFGPEPYRAETKTMDFREGGHWLFAMVGPNGDKGYSMCNYLKIDPLKSFIMQGGFSDENGVVNPSLPQNKWENTFIEADQKTRVEMLLTYNSLADLEKEIEMGFKEGMIQDFEQLDTLLKKL